MNNVDAVKNLIITNPKYNFLKTDIHLGSRITLLTVFGSHSYGTNTEASDIDIRGVCLEFPKEIIGLYNFEQYQNNETDTVIYGFNKFIHLCEGCNPSVIEMLGERPDCYLKINDVGQMIIDNRQLFLTKKCIKSFGGYAHGQLIKIKKFENTKSITPKALAKHGMHLIRLLLIGSDILDKREIIVYRKNEIDLLTSIRNGNFQYENGSFNNEFYKIVDYYKNIFDNLSKSTKIPDNIDFDKLNKFVMDVNSYIISKGGDL